MRWALITGEYPPQPGGVSDYTRLVARGLAEAGDEVQVWAPRWARPTPVDPGVRVHRLPDHFGPRGLAALDADLNDLPRSFRVLVQYVPHAFGWKAMNLPFCLWLRSRRRHPIWVMFHEVAFSVRWAQPLTHNILGAVTRRMAALVAGSAERLLVSIPAWAALLERLLPGRHSYTWLPLPSNLPTSPARETVARARRALAPDAGTMLVGHFGTYGPPIRAMLAISLPALLQSQPRSMGLLLGRDGEGCRRSLVLAHPELAGRLFAPGQLPAEEAAASLAACDCLVQPYPDGVNTRRTSLMAGLALGLPIVTTEGPLTEPIWRESQAVRLASVGRSSELVGAAEDLLTDPRRRRELSGRASAFYARWFALAHTLKALRL